MRMPFVLSLVVVCLLSMVGYCQDCDSGVCSVPSAQPVQPVQRVALVPTAAKSAQAVVVGSVRAAGKTVRFVARPVRGLLRRACCR